jgi:hypothetical protein
MGTRMGILFTWLKKILPKSRITSASSNVSNASRREAMQLQSDKFMAEMANAVIGISLKKKHIDAYKFTLYLEAPFINGDVKLEVFLNRLWIDRIKTVPRRKGHGTYIYKGIAKAALAINIHRIECRPVGDGVAFFHEHLKFHQADYSLDVSRKGIWEKNI